MSEARQFDIQRQQMAEARDRDLRRWGHGNCAEDLEGARALAAMARRDLSASQAQVRDLQAKNTQLAQVLTEILTMLDAPSCKCRAIGELIRAHLNQQ